MLPPMAPEMIISETKDSTASRIRETTNLHIGSIIHPFKVRSQTSSELDFRP
jgi:hypothetical protein